jgi:hypothetical protein
MALKNVILRALGMKMMFLLRVGMSVLHRLDMRLAKDICNARMDYGIRLSARCVGMGRLMLVNSVMVLILELLPAWQKDLLAAAS